MAISGDTWPKRPLDRSELIAQVQRINAALAAWEVWEWNERLPEAARRHVDRPPIPAEQLKTFRRALLRRLGRS